MVKTAVVILNWNGKSLLEKFLPTVLEHTISDNCQVWVADNGSTDHSVAFLRASFPQVPHIVFDQNYGFAEGYNKALSQIEAEYVVLLNSDVQTTVGCLSALIDYMDTHPEVAAVQPKILDYKNPDQFEYAGAAGGFIDFFGYPFCRGRVLHVIEKDRHQFDTEIPVFWATGACLCIRKKEYDEAGGLDGRFFAHMEEIDLCWRLNARGKKVVCLPQSTVYHVGGASLSAENPHKTYLNFRNNLLMLYKNIPTSRFYIIFFVRFILDILAALHLVIQGNPKNAVAVLRAQKDFLRMKKAYKNIRKENLSKTVKETIPTQYSGSLLWSFYFKRKREFCVIFK